MEQFIRDIISKFGGRYYGSPEEKKAQEYVHGLFDKFSDRAQLIPFKSALHSHFGSLKFFVLIHLLALSLLWFKPLYGMILALTNSVLFIGHFVTYRHWLDFLFPKHTSHNVVGDIEPLKEVKSTLIFAGHIDSVKEFKWWYKLKHPGVVATVIASFSLALFGFFSPLIYFFGDGILAKIIGWLFAILSPTLIVLFDMHGEQVVHGVNDNLTGVAMSLKLGEHFAQHRMDHIRVRIISFGAEEAALRGAFDYVKKNKTQLKQEKALLVNLDTIKDEEYLTIGSSELNTLSFFDKSLITKMQASFEACNTPVKTLPLAVGASDASAFAIEGLPALSLIGMTTETLDETYHTRLDNLDHFNPKAMEKLFPVLVHFAQKMDQDAKD